MESTPLTSTKKCGYCQQWSGWQQSSDDRCEHCGHLLAPRAHADALARNEQENQPMPALFKVEIHPDDSPTVRFFKRIALGGQMLFAAIIAFIVWLVTLAAG